MARPIRVFGDPVLRTPTDEVVEFDDALAQLVDDMFASMYAAEGVGLAANQINNVLAFPGVFRGLLDARARNITTSMLLSAAAALAAVVTDEQPNPSYVVPSVFDPEVPRAVAAAVTEAAQADPSASTVPATSAADDR